MLVVELFDEFRGETMLLKQNYFNLKGAATDTEN